MRPVQEIEVELAKLKDASPRWIPSAPAARDVNTGHRASLSWLERLAVLVTDKVGTMGFFFIIFVWTVVWLGWNMLAPQAVRFDPFPAFVLWLFISNLIQLHLMPLIMVGQNLQGRHMESRAEADFKINKKAEAEIEQILQHLEHQAAIIEKQGELILQLVKRLETSPRAAAGNESYSRTSRFPPA